MKKIYFLLVFALLFGFAVNNKAKADCRLPYCSFITDVVYLDK
jgi:hypothetical protein